ncbi:MAG: ABC-F family ATP-binding cassette domain-containing protein [Ilumatobacteraceae bacterium]|nr:ABC-F family ATP-binding cassette domain-containing protein [Ilumatobacteraceae bacterium]
MTASLLAHHVSASRGNTVLEEVDVVLHPGDRVGLIGPNGVGKSTLLAVLAGEYPHGLTMDSGSVVRRPADATVGLLAQEPARSITETAHQQLRRRTGVAAAQADLDRSTRALADGDAGAAERYDVALDRWMRLGAADFDERAAVQWDELGLAAHLLGQHTATLSGGEAARCQLAGLLLSRFDVVLLDEPTNDLDAESLTRLERWLVSLRAPALIVSHDRALLEAVITGVIELDEHHHRAERFEGGWQAYLDERVNRRRLAQERYDRFVDQKRSLAVRAQREREWATRGMARVRRSDEPDRNIRAFKIAQTEQLAGRAARTERAIDRLEEVDEPRDGWELRLTVPEAGRGSDVVASVDGLVVRRGGPEDFTLGPIDLEINWGDRVALIGANGSGKTTLIDALLGRIEPGAGTVRLGPGVVVGEIGQRRDGLRGPASVLATFVARAGDRGGAMTDVDARTLLAKFGIGADHVGRPIDAVSPGERTRIALALLQAVGANTLVLDEPTNHLDLAAIEQLEAVLSSFGGTSLLVTHDRRLLERFSATRLIELAGGRIVRQSDHPAE